MKTFDVFLKDRITKVDIIISTLIAREVFSFYEKLLIYCTMQEIKILKKLSGNSSIELRTKLQQLYTTAYALAKSQMILDVNVDTSLKSFASGETEMLLSAAPVDSVVSLSQEFQNYLTLTAALQSIDGSLSLGDAGFDLTIQTKDIDTKKLGYAQGISKMMLNAQVDFSGKKVISPESIDWTISVNPFGVFYLALVSGETMMNICSAALPDVWEKKSLQEIHFDLFLSTEMRERLMTRKAISGDSEIYILSSAIWLWKKMLYPYMAKTLISCEASAGFYRHRLLSEMDSLTLTAIDDLTLYDLDYIEIS